MAEMRLLSLGRKNKLQVGCVASIISWFKFLKVRIQLVFNHYACDCVLLFGFAADLPHLRCCWNSVCCYFRLDGVVFLFAKPTAAFFVFIFSPNLIKTLTFYLHVGTFVSWVVFASFKLVRKTINFNL